MQASVSVCFTGVSSIRLPFNRLDKVKSGSVWQLVTWIVMLPMGLEDPQCKVRTRPIHEDAIISTDSSKESGGSSFLMCLKLVISQDAVPNIKQTGHSTWDGEGEAGLLSTQQYVPGTEEFGITSILHFPLRQADEA
ncbi:unnamed protein product [Caretta caretta]